MRHVCAWCKCETAPPDGTADDDLISHGICQECKKLVVAEMEGLEGMDIEHRMKEIKNKRLREI